MYCRACFGQNSTQAGLPLQKSHIATTWALIRLLITPSLHLSMHIPQPSQRSLSIDIIPFFSLEESASFGHDLTQAGSSQSLQDIAMLKKGSILVVLIRECLGLREPSFSAEQMYSQIRQPLHLDVSQMISFLTVLL